MVGAATTVKRSTTRTIMTETSSAAEVVVVCVVVALCCYLYRYCRCCSLLTLCSHPCNLKTTEIKALKNSTKQMDETDSYQFLRQHFGKYIIRSFPIYCCFTSKQCVCCVGDATSVCVVCISR